MKIILILALIYSSSVFACKPAPVSCDNPTATFDKKKVDRLENKVATYQTLLDKFIVIPTSTDSCFNNHFAGYYLGGLQNHMYEKNKVCEEFRSKITEAVKRLVNPDSEENKSVSAANHREELKKLGEEIKRELKDF